MEVTCYVNLFLAISVANNFVACDTTRSNRNNPEFGLDNILQGLSDVADLILDFTGDADGCIYKCKNGAIPYPKPNHKPSSNGCGSLGLELNTSALPGVTKCCDAHDFCYDTCNTDKQRCDRKFYKCLDNICHRMEGTFNKDIIKGCRSTAGLMYTGTLALGCKSYKEAQKDACTCDKTRHGEF